MIYARITNEGKQKLIDHLKAVSKNSKKVVQRKELSFNDLSDEDIEKISYIIGACHDFGKSTSFFQDYLDPDTKDPKRTMKQHSGISAFYTYYSLKKEGFGDLISILGWLITLKHHGDLNNLLDKEGELSDKLESTAYKSNIQDQAINIKENNLDEVINIYKELGLNHVKDFLEEVNSGAIFDELERLRLELKLDFPKDSSIYYLVFFLYSVLLDNDKTNSAGVKYGEWESVGRTKSVKPNSVDEYKEKELSVETNLDLKREKAYQQVSEKINELDENLLSLTLPTGGGKTLNALNLALKIREREDFKRDPRIIYSLPFLSIIDQNYDVIKKVLKVNNYEVEPDLLLRHDHKSSGYAEKSDDKTHEQLENPDRDLLMTEGWNSEIITTTFVQFFETLITNRNKNARKFHKMVNSVILLDEIQAIPTKYWEGIRKGIKVLTNQFNSYVILLTATNPLIFEPKKEIEETIENYEEYFKEFDRIKYHLERDSKTLSEYSKELINKTNNNPGKDVMVVLNTIKSTKELYKFVNDQVDRKIIYLSTNILPKHREERIEEIKNSDEPLLIITTQLIEAGVDIDINIVYRDFAPLDSIVQTAGRSNRENQGRKGEVHVIKLLDEEGPREHYYNYIYDSTLTSITKKVLSTFSGKVTESKFNSEAIAEYFEQVKNKKSKDSEKIVESMKNLNYGKINLSLIEQGYETVQIFFEIEKEADKIYEEVEKVWETYRGYNRKGKMLELKSDFYKYILDVKVSENDLENLPPTSFTENILKVSKDKVDRWYDNVTGFHPPENSVEDRIL